MSDRRLTFMCGPGVCISKAETAQDRAAEKLFQQWLQDYRKEHGDFPESDAQADKLVEFYAQARKMKNSGRRKKVDLAEVVEVVKMRAGAEAAKAVRDHFLKEKP